MRASRLLAILILLQVRGRVTAQALADEFEVSVRTIYRDIDALSMAGIPVYGDAGPGGGFQLLDGYRTRLTGLGQDEAEALLLIGMPKEAGLMGLGEASARARDKVVASLPDRTGALATRIADCFLLDTADWYRATRPVPHLGAVARAVIDRTRLTLDYQSWTSRKEWEVEPWGLVLKVGNWYLVAHSSGRTLSFNVADIHAVDAGAACAGAPAGFDLSQWWREAQDRFEQQLRPGRAILRASPVGIQRLRMLGAFAGRAIADATPAEQAGWVVLTLPIETLDSAAPMLLGIGPEIDILDPPELRNAVRMLALQVARRMEGGSHEPFVDVVAARD